MKNYKPKLGEKYWIVFVTDTIRVNREDWDNYDVDREYYKIGNCFKTKKEAQEKANQFKKLLKK